MKSPFKLPSLSDISWRPSKDELPSAGTPVAPRPVPQRSETAPPGLVRRDHVQKKQTLAPRSQTLPLPASRPSPAVTMGLIQGAQDVDATRAQATNLGREIVAKLPQDEASAAQFARQVAVVANAIELLTGDGSSVMEATPGGLAPLQKASMDLKLLAAALRHQPGTGIGKLDPSMAAMVTDFAGQIDAHLQACREHVQANPNPLTGQQVFRAKSFATESALRVIDQHASDPGLTPEQKTMFDNARVQLRARMDAFRAEPDTTPLSAKAIERLMGSPGVDKGLDAKAAGTVRDAIGPDPDFLDPAKMPALPRSDPGVREEGIMELYLGALFEKAGLAPPDLSRALFQGRMAALNGQPWNVIEKTVPFTDARHRKVDVLSTIVPQSRLHPTFDDMKGGGLNCYMTAEAGHAVNLAVSRLEVPDQEAPGSMRKLFEAIRHGTVTPYDISGARLKKMPEAELVKMIMDLLPLDKWEPQGKSTPARIRTDKKYREACADIMRAAAADRRARDIATTALVKDPAKLAKALAGEPVSVELTSISLLTPDVLRSLHSRGRSKGANERLMWQDQLGAWNRLEGKQTLMVGLPGGGKWPVQVDVSVNAFNFGVNKIAFGTQNPQLARLTGWAKSDEQNAKAMTALIGAGAAGRRGAPLGGRVQAWLDAHQGHADAKHVEKLATQVQAIWNDKSYQSGKTEPYKLVKRLAVLNSMLGQDVCFNCKSGKDRTGECDVESKLLALQIAQDGDVPEPEAAASAREKNNLFQMATQGGNLEYQQLNTGAPGFKLTGVPALRTQLSDTDTRAYFEHFRGLSKFIGS